MQTASVNISVNLAAPFMAWKHEQFNFSVFSGTPPFQAKPIMSDTKTVHVLLSKPPFTNTFFDVTGTSINISPML